MAARSGIVLFTAWSTVFIAACSLVVQADRDQCTAAPDCLGHGLSGRAICVSNVCMEPLPEVDSGSGAADTGPVDPIWGCLGNVVSPKIEPAVPVRIQWRFVSALAEQPLAGVRYQACGGLDTGCIDPIPGTTGETTADGVMDVQLYKGFRGYLNLTPGSTANIKEALFYFPSPEKDQVLGSAEVNVHLLSPAEFTFVVQSLPVEPLPQYGHIFGFAFDCQGNPAKGVTAKLETVANETKSYYSDSNRTPSLTQQETSELAEAGFINVPIGSARVNYFRNLREGGKQIGSVNVMVRAGHITFAPLAPSP